MQRISAAKAYEQYWEERERESPAQQRHRKALAKTLYVLKRPLMNFALARGATPADAEELVQKLGFHLTFTTFEKLPQDEKQVWPWLTVRLKHRLIDLQRRNARLSAAMQWLAETSGGSDCILSTSDPAEAFPACDIDSLQKAIPYLPDEGQWLIDQIFFKDKGSREIGRMLGCEHAAVCVLLNEMLDLLYFYIYQLREQGEVTELVPMRTRKTTQAISGLLNAGNSE